MIPVWATLAILSAIALAIKEIIIKNSLNHDLNKSYIIFGEHIFLTIFCLLFFKLINFSSINTMWYYFLAKSIIVLVAMELYFILLKKYEISKISPLMNLSPMFLLLFSAILLHEKVSLIQFGGIILILFATYFLEIDIRHLNRKKSQKHYMDWLKNLNWKNISMVFAMLILYSLLAILDKSIFNQGVSVFTNMFYSSIFVGIMYVGYYIQKKSLFKSVKYVIKQPVIIAFSFLTFLSAVTVLYAIAIPTAQVSLIIPLRRISTLFAAIFGGLLFHESHILKKVISVIIMLFGVLLIVL